MDLGDNMKNDYVIEYINEYEYKKIERTLKKYNMLAYKKLLFEHYPNLKEGIFNGKIISDKSEKIKYKLDLPTDNSFAKVHGQISIIYIVDKKPLCH